MLTQEEKVKILSYMAEDLNSVEISPDNIKSGSVYYSTWRDQRLNSITDETSLARVRELLTQTDKLTQIIYDAPKRFAVTALSQGEININRNEMVNLRAERKRIIMSIDKIIKISSADA